MNHHDAPEDAAVATLIPDIEQAQLALAHWVRRPDVPIEGGTFQDAWLGTPVLLRYLKGRCAEVNNRGELVTEINAACEFTVAANNTEIGLRCNDLGVVRGRKETWALARALCHLARAVVGGGEQSNGLHAWSARSNPDDFATVFHDLQIVFESYHTAWNLSGDPVTVEVGQRFGPAGTDLATAILDAFQRSLKPDPKRDWFTRANWLIVRRLLSYLLPPDASPVVVGHTNRMHLLAAAPTDNEGGEAGRVLTATTQALVEGQDALYLDPVTCGLMTIDDDLRTCLAVCSHIIIPDLKHLDASGRTGLRISWDESTVLPQQLGGDSGGGLLVVSSIATARNNPLDPGATASFAIQPKPKVSAPQNVDDAEQPPTPPLRLEDYCLAPVGGIRAKLTNNPQLRSNDVGIQRVYLRAGQTLDPYGTTWDDWVPKIASDTGLTILPVGSTKDEPDDIRTTLDQLIHAMTGNARKERVLDAFCDHQHQQWQQRCPSAFVEFRFGRLPEKDEPIETAARLARRDEDSKSEVSSAYKPVTDKKDATAEDQLQALLALGPRICLTEDAGAGKTMASHRLLHSLTDRTRMTRENQQSPLVARFEPREHNWPSDLRQSLMNDLIQSGRLPSGPDAVTAAEVVDYAIEKNRLILIFDAFDQVYDGPSAVKNRTEILQSIWAFFHQHPCQVIVTSRVFAVRPETSTTYFPREKWKFATIFGFNADEQTDYLRQAKKLRPDQHVADLFNNVVGGKFENIYERDAEIRRLLSVPNNLNLLRELPDDQIRRIRNRFDLYQKFHQQQLNRATKDGSSLDSRKCHLMLAAAGFQMMVDERWNYSLLDDPAETLERRVDERCQSHGHTLTDEDWTQLKTWSQLTNHGILDDIGSKGTRRAISWKHRGWMEYFAARYLTLFASEKETEESRKHNGESNWYWTWRFVLEAPLEECIDTRWQRAVTLLFSPVPDKHKSTTNTQTKRTERELILRPRPTELMFRAWQVMECGLLTADRMWNVRDAVLGAYRQQFVDILLGPNEDRAERAAELITREDFDKHLASRSRSSSPSASCSPLPPGEGPGVRAAPPNDSAPTNAWLQRMRQMYSARPTYAECSDAKKPEEFRRAADAATREREYTSTKHLTFLMGASPKDTSAYGDEKYDDSHEEKWWIEQKVDAFQMATCCVTRAQYRLFDPHREQDKLLGNSGINERSPDEDCPVTYVDWWDAFCFALWLGEEYQLPTERQWEGAAWGGIDRRSHKDWVVSVYPYTAGFTSNEVNHDGKNPIEGQQESDESQRTLPVRWDDQRRRSPLSEPKPAPERLPSAYKANGFGLWHVNGNVWEWCESGWEGTLKAAIVADGKDVNSSTGRVVRGGSWGISARFTRTSDRDWFVAEDRFNFTGFRLSRTS